MPADAKRPGISKHDHRLRRIPDSLKMLSQKIKLLLPLSVIHHAAWLNEMIANGREKEYLIKTIKKGKKQNG
jgi:hypothetical protein